MEQRYLSDDVFKQIKDFDHYRLTNEQKLFIDKLMLKEGLKKHYELFDLCKECKHPKVDDYWCYLCSSKHFQQDFKNWASRNSEVDKFIQDSQLNVKNKYEILEWIECDKLENIEYIAKGGFG